MATFNESIADDIETVLAFARQSRFYKESKTLSRAADRLEAWLATYEPDDKGI